MFLFITFIGTCVVSRHFCSVSFIYTFALFTYLSPALLFVGFKYMLIVTFELEFTSPFIRKAVTSLLILFNSPEKVVHTLSESILDPASSFVLMFSSVVVYKVKSVPPSISNPFRTYAP